jgi:hypothetical protein
MFFVGCKTKIFDVGREGDERDGGEGEKGDFNIEELS